MSVHRGNLPKMLERAWACVLKVADSDPIERDRNKERSRQWVNALAEEFEDRYDEKLHRVFWQRNWGNREQFKLNELLFDLMVCSVSSVESLRSASKRLEFIDQCHWQVESEFERSDSRAVVIDMSKLVVGAAENKLFISAQRRNEQLELDLLRLCARIARRCSGNVYLAFVAHPAEWDDVDKNDDRKPKLYEWLAGDWERLGARKQDDRARA